MKPKTLPVLEMCIETGINVGWYRAHKHTDTPTQESLEQNISRAIMEQIYEWFDMEKVDD